MSPLSNAARAERHALIAMQLWFFGVFGSAAVGFAWSELVGPGAEALTLVLALLVNLCVAWHLSIAAQAQGRRRWLWGVLAAIGPPMSMMVSSVLLFSGYVGGSRAPD